jgi:hypothetical protein
VTAHIAVLRIERAADAADRATLRLFDLMKEHCPGPHEFVDHDDERAAWCTACHYGIGGRPVPRTGDTAAGRHHRRQQNA